MAQTPIDMMLDKKVVWRAVDPPKNVDGSIPYVTHTGELVIMGTTVPVYQLSNGMRVFPMADIARMLEEWGNP